MKNTQPISYYSPAFYQNPYERFQQFIEKGEIHRVKFPSGVYGWLVTGYDAAIKTLKHPHIRKSHKIGNAQWSKLASVMPEPQHTRLQQHLLHQDPPRHTEMRSLIMEAFSPSRTEKFREKIEKIVYQLIEPLIGSGECDLIADFALPMPLLVLSEVIGLSEKHREQFKPEWCKAVQPLSPNHPGRAGYLNLLDELQSYIEDIIIESRGGDSDRLIVQLISARDNNKLSHDELTSILFQLLVAGQEPVTNQIGNAILALLEHPEQLEALKQDATNMDDGLTELLRYDGSFAFTTWRFFNQKTEWLGQTIPAGETIIVALNAANHDPAKFSCPHQLNFNRKRNKSLSFGYGNHFCPAMPLARLELEISIRAILQYLPNIQLACDIKELDWINAVLTRGLHALPVIYTSEL